MKRIILKDISNNSVISNPQTFHNLNEQVNFVNMLYLNNELKVVEHW